MSLKVLPDVTFTKSCVLSLSPALRYSVGIRYCSQCLVLEHSLLYFLPYLGARNTFYGHAKQKVGVGVHDFFLFFAFFFPTLIKFLAKFFIVLQSFVRRQFFFNSSKLSLACSNVIFIVDTFQ